MAEINVVDACGLVTAADVQGTGRHWTDYIRNRTSDVASIVEPGKARLSSLVHLLNGFSFEGKTGAYRGSKLL